MLGRILVEAGYAVDAVADAEEAQAYLRAYEYGVAVFDWRLPGMDGVDLVAWSRKKGLRVPILMLTARDTTSDRIQGLDAGADDYLMKPFDNGELLARLRALLRRQDSHIEPVLRVGSLMLDPAAHEFRVGHDQIDVTPREYAIMELLLRRYPSVVSRSSIAQQAWPDEADAVGSNTIDVHIARLRAKLARADVRLATVRGVGYKLVEQ